MPTKAEVPSRRRARAAAASRESTPDSNGQASPGVPDEARRNQMIAVAAYFRAERRGFAPGDPLQDWLMAEAEIARMFPSQGNER